MRRALVLSIVLLALVGPVLVATDASVLPGDSDDEANHLTESIVAYPAPGSNGAYALLDADGELTIDMTSENPQVDGDGVPPDALTGVDDVFRLENHGDGEATVWIETDEEWLTLYTETGPIDEENAITLDPDEWVSVGFSVDSDEKSAGELLETTISIHTTEGPATIGDSGDVSSISWCTPGLIDVVEPTETIRVVEVTRGSTCPSSTADLQSLPIGEPATLESMDLRFDASEPVSFEVIGYDPVVGTSTPSADHLEEAYRSTAAVPIGSYAVADAPPPDVVAIDGHVLSVDRDWLDREGIDPADLTLHEVDDGTWTEHELTTEDYDDRIEFVADIDGRSPVVLGVEAPVINATKPSLRSAAIDAGEQATVDATVTNDGAVDADVEITMLADGDAETVVTATVPAEDTVELALDARFDEAAEYELALEYRVMRVGGTDLVVDQKRQKVGNLTVTEPVENPNGQADDGNDSADDSEESPSETDESSLAGVWLVLGSGLVTVSVVALLWKRTG